MFGSIIVSIVFTGKPTYGAWQLWYSAQIMRTVALMHVNIPANLYSYMTKRTIWVTGYPGFMTTIITIFSRNSGFDEGENSLQRYSDYGLEKPQFLSRTLCLFVFFEILFIIFVIGFCLTFPLAFCIKYFKKRRNAYSSLLCMNFFMRFIQLYFLDLLMLACLNIIECLRENHYFGKWLQLGYFFSWLFIFCALMIIPWTFCWMMCCNPENQKSKPIGTGEAGLGYRKMFRIPTLIGTIHFFWFRMVLVFLLLPIELTTEHMAWTFLPYSQSILVPCAILMFILHYCCCVFVKAKLDMLLNLAIWMPLFFLFLSPFLMNLVISVSGRQIWGDFLVIYMAAHHYFGFIIISLKAVMIGIKNCRGGSSEGEKEDAEVEVEAVDEFGIPKTKK